MTTALIPSTSAVLLRGQRAWLRIKATAAEQRELWRNVGEALLVGRRDNPSNQAFGAWCKAHGFDMDGPTRSDAMWFASYRDGKTEIPADLTHPKNIRQWARETSEPALPPADTAIDTLLVNAAKVAGKERGILAKAAHAQEDTPEGRTAKRMLERQAAALDMSPECRRRSNLDHQCQSNIDQGLVRPS